MPQTKTWWYLFYQTTMFYFIVYLTGLGARILKFKHVHITQNYNICHFKTILLNMKMLILDIQDLIARNIVLWFKHVLYKNRFSYSKT